MEPNEVKDVPVDNPKSEEGAEELQDSAMMLPYVRLAEALITKKGLKEAVARIGDLPLERRYLWRILSALKWGFADFDSVNVMIDRRTLRPDDRERVAEQRPDQPRQIADAGGDGASPGDQRIHEPGTTGPEVERGAGQPQAILDEAGG